MLKILDVYMGEGHKAILSVALALLELHAPALTKGKLPTRISHNALLAYRTTQSAGLCVLYFRSLCVGMAVLVCSDQRRF